MSNISNITGTGKVQKDTVLLRYDRLYAVKDSEDVVVCGLVDADQRETVLLKFKLPEEPEQKEAVLREFVEVGRRGERADASQHLRNIESWAISRGLDLRLCSPGDSGAGLKLDSIQFCYSHNLPTSPAERKDTRTGFLTGLALESADVIQQIEARIPGKKIFAFLDFDNMGLANLAGFGEQIDSVLEKMSGAAARSFSDGSYEVFRRGGDEFVILLKDDGVDSLAALNKFKDEVRRVKEKELPAEHSKLRTVEIMADLKLRAAELIKDYFESTGDSPRTAADFRDFILKDYRSEGLGGVKDIGELVLRAVETDFWAYRAAGVASTARVMDFTLAAVRLDEPLTVNLIHKAHGMCEKIIFKNKLEDGGGPIEPVEIDPGIKERSAERALAKEVNAEEQDFDAKVDLLKKAIGSEAGHFSKAEALRAAIDVERAAAKDPALGSILRFPLVADKPIQFILDIHEPKELSLTTVKLRGFSLLNKHFGYERADEVLRNIAELFAEECPAAVGVRTMGGMIAFAHAAPLPESAVSRFAENAANYLNITLNSERYDVEHAVRQALDARLTGLELAPCPKLRELDIEQKRIKAYPKLTFREMMA